MTTQVAGDKYQNLLTEKAGRGWPYMAFLDADGELLAMYPGDWTTEAIAHSAMLAQTVIAMSEPAEAGKPEAMVKLFSAQMELGMVDSDQATRRLAKLKKLEDFGKLVSPERLARFEQEIVNLEFMGIVHTMNLVREDPAEWEKGVARLFAMKKAARIPNNKVSHYFWNVMLGYARQRGDADLIIEVGQDWKKHLDPENSEHKKWIPQIDDLIAKAKDKKAAEKIGEAGKTR